MTNAFRTARHPLNHLPTTRTTHTAAQALDMALNNYAWDIVADPGGWYRLRAQGRHHRIDLACMASDRADAEGILMDMLIERGHGRGDLTHGRITREEG
jgi:hypothetical protein